MSQTTDQFDAAHRLTANQNRAVMARESLALLTLKVMPRETE